jgi:hypothetical protein
VNPKYRFDLMGIVTYSFGSIGPEISYPRIQYINPFIPALAMAPEDRRNNIIRQIVDKQYPFTAENRAEWGLEIHQAGGIE